MKKKHTIFMFENIFGTQYADLTSVFFDGNSEL